ncbi:MAG: alpha/beta hydrolase [Ponticaulis sp.]|nr:alpha/beta hydrolase [Ponticaulis sp.]
MVAPTPEATETAAQSDTLMSWADLLAMERAEPQAVHAYGELEQQVIDIWLPEGEGPHPVVLMVHGGCWQKAIANRTLMNYMAEALRQRGLAVWNIEYRGVDEAGGGYPGTFQDVSAAADALIASGADYNLDTSRIVGLGHSAGGHLVTWLAARENVPDGSVLAGGEPLPMRAVINSGGLADLEASAPVTLETCLANIQDQLTGTSTDGREDVFADTSSARLQPSSVPQISVNGAMDHIAPPALGIGYTDVVSQDGGEAQFVEVQGAGHVELIAPGTEAFDVQAELIERYLK